ncbi:MAG: ceramidase domain-containing protein [Burkholderiales bacterium]|nr:ceramidase domain-containing protein [Burkholderiales bacterium]
MNTPTSELAASMDKPGWRHVVLAALVLGSLIGILSLAPIAQDADYHAFADRRTFAGIPNGCNILSNLPFLLVGVLGLRFCLRAEPGAVRSAWIALFAGVALVSIGSAWYHWQPANATLVWDRLPMTIAFMGLFVALLGEYVSKRLAAVLLLPAVALGIASVLYWYWTDDLSPYVWIQLVPLLAVPAVMILFRSGYSHQWLLLVALGWYVFAKVAELYDLPIFSGTQELVSGHSLKHLFAAASCYSILLMLQRRKPVPKQGPL